MGYTYTVVCLPNAGPTYCNTTMASTDCAISTAGKTTPVKGSHREVQGGITAQILLEETCLLESYRGRLNVFFIIMIIIIVTCRF